MNTLFGERPRKIAHDVFDVAWLMDKHGYLVDDEYRKALGRWLVARLPHARPPVPHPERRRGPAHQPEPRLSISLVKRLDMEPGGSMRLENGLWIPALHGMTVLVLRSASCGSSLPRKREPGYSVPAMPGRGKDARSTEARCAVHPSSFDRRIALPMTRVCIAKSRMNSNRRRS